MNITLTAPSQIEAQIKLPSSKSICNRALIIRALSGEESPLHNLSDCDDTRVLIKAFAEGGPHFDIMAAGTAMRFLTAYLAQTPGEWTITGTERMCHRPIHLLVDALRSLGAHIEYMGNEGFPPLRIIGRRLQGGALSMSAGVSSQYISALLMIAPHMNNGLTLCLTGELISRPYISMTLQIMRQWGVKCDWVDNVIKVPHTPYTPAPFTIEGDWSAASYWYEIVAFTPGSRVILPALYCESTQGDSRVSEFFKHLGVVTEYTDMGIILQHVGMSETSPLHLDLSDQPDLAQTLAVTCAMLGRRFCFTGLQTLRIKETDRISALECELEKLGYKISNRADSILEWDGARCKAQSNPRIATYDDHRMAMAFAPVARFIPGIEIAHSEVVSKSYPSYWQHLSSAGFKIIDKV